MFRKLFKRFHYKLNLSREFRSYLLPNVNYNYLIFGLGVGLFGYKNTDCDIDQSTTSNIDDIGTGGVIGNNCQIPERYINGCNGDIKEATSRWKATEKWRVEEGIQNLLVEEQKHFHTIKNIYPHYVCGKGKHNHIVYYERPGELDTAKLKAHNIQLTDILRHYLFITEFQWAFFDPLPLAKSIAVIDVGSVSIYEVAGEALSILRKMVSIANLHYPERAHVIYIVNVPVWFSWLWGLVKPLVHPNTLDKVRILSQAEVLQGLLEHIDIEQVPVYYGGSNDKGGGIDSCRFKSEEEQFMRSYVDVLNEAYQKDSVQNTNRDGGSRVTAGMGTHDINVYGPQSLPRNKEEVLLMMDERHLTTLDSYNTFRYAKDRDRQEK